MPRGDRMGPNSLGPMTGRGMGFCAGYDTPGYMNPSSGYGRECGRGFGMRRGFGAGFGRGYAYRAPAQPIEYREPTKEELLKEMEAEKADIEKAIQELKKEKK